MNLCSSLLVLATSVALHAASLSDQLPGHWEAQVTSESRTFPVLFNFKVNGSVLTGTVEFPSLDRGEIPITEGKVNGNSISFKGFGIWTGTLEGSELALTRELDGGKKQHMKAHHTAE